MKLGKAFSKVHKALSHVNPTVYAVERLRHKYLPTKKIKSALGLNRPANSAGSYNIWSQGVYGSTGSIVGRY